MTELKKQYSDLLYAFKYAWKLSGAYVFRYLVFQTLSTVSLFLFDVYFFSYVLKLLTDNAGWESVRTVCLWGALLVFVRICCGKYAEVMQLAYSETIMIGVKRELYEKSLDFKLADFADTKHYDEYSFVIAHGSETVDSSVSIFANIIASLFFCCFFVAELLHQNIVVVLLLLGSLSLYVLINWFIENILIKIGYENDVARQPFVRKNQYFERLFYLKDFAYDLKDNKTFGFMSKQYEESMRCYQEEYIHCEKRRLRFDIINRVHTNSFQNLLVPLLIIFSFKIVGINDISVYWKINALFLNIAGLYMFKIRSEVRSLSKYISQMQRFLSSFGRDEAKEKRTLTLAPAISIRNLDFAYDNNTNFLIENMNLDINSGEKVAIVGRNGSGKSTLMNLLIGLYTPKKGEILINGENVSSYAMNENSVSYMSQNVNLFATTLNQNIRMGDDAYTDDEVEKAARYSQCDEFIQKLPKGLETTIGHDVYEDATELSGGQAQRISLAREFLSRANLLLMDEPTAAVDPIFEKPIIEDLMKSAEGKTVVMITHRLDITKYADTIYVMENGIIMEHGSFTELMSDKTIFHDMYCAQMEG